MEHQPMPNETTVALRSVVVGLARELYDRFVMGGWEPQDSYELIEDILNPTASGGWRCADLRQDTAGCDWPLCGCDPYANKVVTALDEAGCLTRAEWDASHMARVKARLIGDAE